MTVVDLTPAQPDAGMTADELAPVRDFLLARARKEAADLVTKARTDAAAVTAAGQREAAAILADARARGAADGAAMAAADLTQARRRAREEVLRAQRAAFDELRRRCRAAARDLQTAPEYGTLRARLDRIAREQAGSAGAISEHAEGGIVVEAPGWRLDLSLPALADRAIDALGPELEGLWTP
jgi:vacuolar-type H+-ATPase subunit E/Vma4